MNSNITDKTYKKLTLQVSLNGLSYCVFDTLSGNPIFIEHIHFDSFQKSAKIEDLFEDVFKKSTELNSQYDEIVVLHSNNLSTFVPVPLFDEEFIASYLQYNTKVFETDFFTFDELPNYGMNNVYIPYINMNNYFIDRFGSFTYKHSSTVLVSKLLAVSKNNEERKMFVHLSNRHFEIIVVQNMKLLLYNSFDYKTPKDFIYYILFTAEQLQLNPENFKLELLGSINTEDEFYKIAYKYVRNVSLMEQENISINFSVSQNREHFILLNS